MEQDKFQCYTWAKKQTGFYPMQQASASEPPPQQQPKRGGVGRGAVKEAVAGAAVGSLSGEMGKGAANGGLF